MVVHIWFCILIGNHIYVSNFLFKVRFITFACCMIIMSHCEFSYYLKKNARLLDLNVHYLLLAKRSHLSFLITQPAKYRKLCG
jgi:hypothetical protein